MPAIEQHLAVNLFGTYTVTQADMNAGQITNSATATGTPPTGPDAPNGFHMLRFDDKAGKEQLLLRSQNRLDVTALGTRYESIGGDRNLTVGWIDTKHQAVGGNYMGKVRSNWFLGIRTPWTLSSELSWEKSHRLLGRLFVISAGVTLAVRFAIGVEPAYLTFAASVTASALLAIVSSYVYWKQDPERRTA